jgi:hypothetical protein
MLTTENIIMLIILILIVTASTQSSLIRCYEHYLPTVPLFHFHQHFSPSFRQLLAANGYINTKSSRSSLLHHPIQSNTKKKCKKVVSYVVVQSHNVAQKYPRFHFDIDMTGFKSLSIILDYHNYHLPYLPKNILVHDVFSHVQNEKD